MRPRRRSPPARSRRARFSGPDCSCSPVHVAQGGGVTLHRRPARRGSSTQRRGAKETNEVVWGQLRRSTSWRGVNDLDRDFIGVAREQVEVAGDDRFGAAGDGERDEVVVAGVAAHRWVRARRIGQAQPC